MAGTTDGQQKLKTRADLHTNCYQEQLPTSRMFTRQITKRAVAVSRKYNSKIDVRT